MQGTLRNVTQNAARCLQPVWFPRSKREPVHQESQNGLVIQMLQELDRESWDQMKLFKKLMMKMVIINYHLINNPLRIKARRKVDQTCGSRWDKIMISLTACQVNRENALMEWVSGTLLCTLLNIEKIKKEIPNWSISKKNLCGSIANIVKFLKMRKMLPSQRNLHQCKFLSNSNFFEIKEKLRKLNKFGSINWKMSWTELKWTKPSWNIGINTQGRN